MKRRRFFVLLLSLVALLPAAAQKTPPSADEVLKSAFTQAAIEKKNVFVLFHASWCGWCHAMDTAMNDPAVKDFFTKSYVIRHLTVYESEKKKAHENPGALELLAKYHGNDQGIPYWLIFDESGKLLADSQARPDGTSPDAKGSNTGCPASKEEVAHFINVLKKTSSLKEQQLAVIEKRFRENESGN